MFIKVTKDNVVITDKDNQNTHKGEYKITDCEFEFSSEYNNLIKMANFTVPSLNKTYTVDILENKCIIPGEVFSKAYQEIKFGVFAYDLNTDNSLKLRYSPCPDSFVVKCGSYVSGSVTPEIMSVTQYELYSKALQEGLAKIEDAETQAEYAKTQGNYAKSQGDYAKAQGDYAKQVGDGYSGTIAELRALIPTKVSDLPNDVEYINKNVNNLSNYYGKTDTYNKTEIDSKLGSIYKYKGSVPTYDDLPTSNLVTGDTYNVEDTGDNYSWVADKNEWDKLGGTIDLSSYYTKSETDNLLNQKVDTNTLNSYYTSSQVDTKLSGKVNNSTYESKVQEIETSLDSKLEASDLNDYVKNTDYASDSKSGVVKLNLSKTGLKLNSNNELEPTVLTSGQAYQGVNDEFVMSKRTFEIAVGGKGYATSSYVDEKIGDIESVIDLINGETLSTTSLLNEEVE